MFRVVQEHFSQYLSLERFRNAVRHHAQELCPAADPCSSPALTSSACLLCCCCVAVQSIQDLLGRPGFGHRNLATHVYKGFSLFHVVESMARIATHRVAITNSERKVTGLITQSMVISLLDQHMDRLGALATSHTVEEIMPGLFDQLRVVHETDSALTAFKMMVRNGSRERREK